MARMYCKECHKAISSSATTCPRCGWINDLNNLEKMAAIEKYKNENFLIFFIGLIIMFLLFFIIYSYLPDIIKFFSSNHILVFKI